MEELKEKTIATLAQLIGQLGEGGYTPGVSWVDSVRALTELLKVLESR